MKEKIKDILCTIAAGAIALALLYSVVETCKTDKEACENLMELAE